MHDPQQAPIHPWTPEAWLAAVDAALRQRRLTQKAVWVAQALLRLLPEGAGSVTKDEIAEVAGVSNNATATAIARLVECGLLARIRRKPPSHRNFYTLVMPPERRP